MDGKTRRVIMREKNSEQAEERSEHARARTPKHEQAKERASVSNNKEGVNKLASEKQKRDQTRDEHASNGC